VRLGTLEEFLDRLRIERFEDEHAGARKQRGIERERGVLRRRANERDRPILHDGQEGILLHTIEAMNLVDEEERSLPLRHPGARGIEGFLQIGDTREDCGDLLELELGLAGEQTRDRGLARSRRPPEDERTERSRLDQPRQHAILAGEMLLPGDLG
jgi:hypothetical protein